MKKVEMIAPVMAVELKDSLLVCLKDLAGNTVQRKNLAPLAILESLRCSCASSDIFWVHFGDVFLSLVGDDDELPDQVVGIVSSLLEIGGCCREVVWLNSELVYDRLLTTVDRACVKGSLSSSDCDRLHRLIRAVLKLEQHLFDRWQVQRRLDRLAGRISLCVRVRNTLIKVMNQSDCPLDSVFLAGMALAFHLNSLDAPVSHSDPPVVRDVLVSMSEISLEYKEEQTYCEEVLMIAGTSGRLVQLPLINGLLACGKPNILLSRSRLSYVDERGLLVLRLYPLIAGFCDGGDHRTYQSFQTLLTWLRWMHVNLDRVTERSRSGPYFDVDSSLLASVLRILDLGFSSPVTGVSDLSSDAYETILEIHKKDGGSGYVHLLRTVMKAPWMVKGKYLQLALLVPRVGFSTLLSLFPLFLEELCESLRSNQLATAGSSVYRSLLTVFRAERADLSEEEITSQWKSTFLPLLLSCLDTSNSICLQNVIRFWLPLTIKTFPRAYVQLFPSFARLSSTALCASMSVLRLARSSGIVTFNTIDAAVLNAALCHTDDGVRTEAFAIVCVSPKKSEVVSVEEVAVLQSFLPVNLNVVNLAFREKLFCHTKTLLVRLRDSCLRLLTKTKRCTPAWQQTVSNEEDDPLLRSTNFLDWFLRLVLDNLRPGGCYQRRHTCLNLYRILLEVFVSAPVNNCRKGIVPVKCGELLHFFCDRGKFLLFTERAFRLLLFCLLDYMEEIQSLAAHILKDNFPRRLNLEEHMDWALSLCSSPKSMHSESGSHICSLIFHGLDYPDRLVMFELVLKKLTEQMSIAEVDMLRASGSAPMHGLVLALRRLVCHTPEFWSRDRDKAKRLLEECLCVAEWIVRHVLGILSSRNDKAEVAPSFKEMGLAIDGIVGSSGEGDLFISREHQLVSSCCWLNLKECSLLLGFLIHCLPLEGSSDEHCLSLSQVDRVGVVMFSILTKCRHRGAIESCNIGLEIFCRKLVGSGHASPMSIPFAMFESALSKFLNAESNASVTRRSAGLPLLIVAVVKSDPRPCRPLMTTAVRRLLHVAELSLVEDPANGVVDVPQAHAFHVLRALVHESVLSHDVLFLMNDIVPACLKGFFSPSWAVRNASLQLFGAVVPRLIGQKKVADDESDHNGMTVSEFCARWPVLCSLLKSHMRNIDIFNDGAHLPETVVPILSLFCRLSRDNSSEDRSEIAELVFPLLGCPMWHVRRMAAFFVAKMCPPHRFGHFLVQLSDSLCRGCKSLNHAHGILLTVLNVVRKLDLFSPGCYLIEQLRLPVHAVLSFVMDTFECPVLSSAALDVCLALPHWLLSELDWNKFSDMKTTYLDWEKPGFSSWMKSVTYIRLSRLPIADLLTSDFQAKKLFSTEVVEAFLLVLRQRLLEFSGDAPSTDYASTQQLLLRVCEKYTSSAVLCPCLDLMLDIYFHSGIGFDLVDAERVLPIVTSLLNAANRSFLSATAIVFWALVIINDDRLDSTNPAEWVEQLNRFCQPQQSEEFRIRAAKALVVGGAFVLRAILRLRISSSFEKPRLSYCAVRIFDSSLTLLQDEETSLRSQAAEFVVALCADRSTSLRAIHPNVAMNMLGDYFVHQFGWNEKLWDHLWTKIGADFSTSGSVSFTVLHNNNLFEQDDINVFAEKCYMSSFYGRLLQGLLLSRDVREWLERRLDGIDSGVCDAVRRLVSLKGAVRSRLRLQQTITKKGGADNVVVCCEPNVAAYLANLHSSLEVCLTNPSPLSAEAKEAFDELQAMIGLK